MITGLAQSQMVFNEHEKTRPAAPPKRGVGGSNPLVDVEKAGCNVTKAVIYTPLFRIPEPLLNVPNPLARE